jgi:hypothetical protein
MKRWFCIIGLAAITLLGSAVKQARAQEATLVSAEAVFETLDNDKDHDSIVCVAVKNGNTVIASSCNTGGHWNDHTDHTVALDVGSGWTRSSLSGHTKTELSFSTNGNDKWEFNYILRLSWSDGNTTEVRYNGQVLTQDDRYRSYAVSL